ncbi:hypothetical protein E2562_027830 [Oryza meyeriana var. granulata]|uniref:Uncharacterized protein n=1 Tax=Oryza meyeriana var. granulata TaxID=110450 RepID=A0A6G1DP34_9ORYZ|nr:hypothetical protein E2562_027830 [Oryza meyeriana var. granulata]
MPSSLRFFLLAPYPAAPAMLHFFVQCLRKYNNQAGLECHEPEVVTRPARKYKIFFSHRPLLH